MYQGPGGMVSRDEYLLGRPIDKYVFEKMEEREAGCSSETGLLPGSIFAPSGANSLLDMASKIREDPLFIIRYGWAVEKGCYRDAWGLFQGWRFSCFITAPAFHVSICASGGERSCEDACCRPDGKILQAHQADWVYPPNAQTKIRAEGWG